MKWRFSFVLVLSFFFFLAQEAVFAQTHSIQIVTFPGLASMDFAGFIITDNLKGAPNVFQVNIMPAGGSIRLHGVLTWKDIDRNATEVQLVDFTTKDFIARSFTNSDLGNLISLKSHTENTNQIQKNIDKGRPTGTYKLTLEVYNALTNIKESSDVATLTFDNPTQTLSLIYPTQGLSLDQGNVLAVWTSVQGIKGDGNSYYFIRASERRNSNQSLEDALRSGAPYINNQKIMGNLTSVNLRTLPLEREWAPGSEVVLQIGAHISGVGGGTDIFSQPVSFSVARSSSATDQAITTTISNILQGFMSSIPPQVLAGLLSGQLGMTGAKGENGVSLSPAEVQKILTFLQSHPQDIIHVTFHSN